MDKITRTIATHTITFAAIGFLNGEFKPFEVAPFIVSGIKKPDEEKAIELYYKHLASIQQKFPAYVTLHVAKITTTEYSYSLDISDFMKYAKREIPKPLDTPQDATPETVPETPPDIKPKGGK